MDTFLGEVKTIVAPTYDTAGHEVSAGYMIVTVGTTDVTASNSIGTGYAVGDHVLLNAYNPTSGATVWSVVGKATSVDVTVSGIHHTNTVNDGVVANGTTYLSSVTYRAIDSCEYVALADTMITQSYRLYLDGQGNLVGMLPLSAITEGVGIVTALDYTRVGTGKYVANVDLFLPDGTNTSLQFVNQADNDFFAQNEAISGFTVGNFIRYETVAVNGTTYYKFAELATQNTDANSEVETGVADTLSTTQLVDDATRFIVANYAYDYSKAETVLQNYSVYTGFKTIPTLTGTVYYYPLTSNGVDYILLTSSPAAAYTQTTKTPEAVDTSALFISKGETYQYYTVYNVVVNGTKTTVNVTNAVNATVEANLGKVISYTGLSNGYYTSVKALTTATTGYIAAGTNPTYAAGVLTAGTDYLTVADNCTVQIVNCATEDVYSATLAHLAQYSANDLSYELDANGYICNLYIIQK